MSRPPENVACRAEALGKGGRRPKLTPEEKLATHRFHQRRHFRQRARQRFGIELSDADLATIVWRIKQDKPGVVFLALQRRASAWRVKWRKKAMVVIYDHRTESVVTCYRFKKWKWE